MPIRTDHVLIEQGPDAWVRQPMYSFGVPFMLGLGRMTANWFVLATGAAAIAVAIVHQVPREEAMLTAAKRTKRSVTTGGAVAVVVGNR